MAYQFQRFTYCDMLLHMVRDAELVKLGGNKPANHFQDDGFGAMALAISFAKIAHQSLILVAAAVPPDGLLQIFSRAPK